MARKAKTDELTLAIDFGQPYHEAAPRGEPVIARGWFDGSCLGNPGETGMGVEMSTQN